MLNITNLSADYGGKPALEEINLTLDSGERWGRPAAGKRRC